MSNRGTLLDWLLGKRNYYDVGRCKIANLKGPLVLESKNSSLMVYIQFILALLRISDWPRPVNKADAPVLRIVFPLRRVHKHFLLLFLYTVSFNSHVVQSDKQLRDLYNGYCVIFLSVVYQLHDATVEILEYSIKRVSGVNPDIYAFQVNCVSDDPLLEEEYLSLALWRWECNLSKALQLK